MPSTYYVVEFWASPRPDVDKCVCVPDTWLKWIDESKAIASVAYPGGNPADIEKLARNNRSNPNDWLAYNASVKFSTSSYERAIEYLAALRKLKSFGTISILPTDERGFSEDLSRPRPTATTSSSGGNNVNNEARKRPSLASPYARTPTGQLRPQEKMKSPAGSRASGSQNPVHDDHPSRSLQAPLASRSTIVSEETSRSSSMHDVQAVRDVSHGCQRPGTSSDHDWCSTKFDAALERMQAEIRELASEVQRMKTVTDQNVDNLIEINEWMKADERWRHTNASHLSNGSSMSEMLQSIRNQTISTEDDDDDDDDVNDGDDVNHGNSTVLDQAMTTEEPRRVLPPKYNQFDSKWTLRYSRPGPALTELLPCSGVYVNAVKLEYCSMVARDCKALAQMLMVEVFTNRALEVCSLMGRKCPTSNCDDPVPPGLDENARNVIMRYAVKCGHERGWHIPDIQTIKNSMRDKLKICKRRVTRAMESRKRLISANNLRFL